MIRPSTGPSFRTLLTTVAISAAASTSPIVAGGQVPEAEVETGITCIVQLPQVSPTSCVLALTVSDPQQAVRLRVAVRSGEQAVANAPVRLRATSGSLLPDSTQSDAAGNVHVLWSRAKSADTATVVLQVLAPPDSASTSAMGVAFIRIAPPTPAGAGTQVGLQRFRLSPAWFERNALPTGPRLEISRYSDGKRESITDDEECAAHRVAFSRFANTGTVSPDTVSGIVYRVVRANLVDQVRDTADTLGCLAVANWTLPEGTGPRSLRATLVPGGSARPAPNRSSAVLHTWARALPRVVAGPVYARQSGYVGVRAGTDTVFKIQRVRPDSSIVTFDSIGRGASRPDTVASDDRWGALIGVTTPVVPGVRGLSVTAGFDVTSPRDHWYAGISILRLPAFAGFATESIPLDIHLLGHWGRSPVLQNPTECARGERCRTKPEQRFHGAAVSVTIDAGTLVSDLIKALGS